ncbi:MAG: hypothetical protein GX161_02200 [Firmicutes bacterium]|jgi:N-acetylglucosamine kinase-like BadF-type ATPase|nr:hypothetical protein [Bacillota bacterium]
MVDVVVGFDAGGTSTQCALMTLDGKVLAHGSAGPGNYQIVRADGVRRALQQSLAAARAAAGHEVRVRAAFLGIAGLTTAQEEQTLAEMCRALDIAPKLQIMGDMVPALAAGTRGEPGIVVIGGTGSICWGLDAAGNTARAGGWGYLFGDEGSGFYIGRRALAAAFQAYDGRGPATSLKRRVLEALDCADLPAVVTYMYGLEQPRTAIAALAPLVFTAAAEGDEVANEILAGAARELAAAVLAVYRKLQFDSDLTVVASGGLFRQSDELYERLRRELAPLLPQARCVLPDVEPVVGACYLALRLLEEGRDVETS